MITYNLLREDQIIYSRSIKHENFSPNDNHEDTGNKKKSDFELKQVVLS